LQNLNIIFKNKFSIIVNQLIVFYLRLTPNKKQLIDFVLDHFTDNLRTYFTIPKPINKSIPQGKSIFNSLGNDFQIINDSFLDKSIRDRFPSVSGYIPYLLNQTKIYFYHFFSVNYGIRKTLVGQLTLLGEKSEIIKSVVIKFPTRFNGPINLKNYFEDIDAVSCILEVYHPRIFNNHAGHQGHLRFWGIYGEDISTVHSMPLFPFIVKNDKPVFAERRIYPYIDKEQKTYYFYNYNLRQKSVHSNFKGDYSTKIKMLSGYTLQMKKNENPKGYDYPTGIWHHSPLTRNNYSSVSEGSKTQLISFPNINEIDALLFFGEFVIDQQEIEFTLYCPENKYIMKKKKQKVNIYDQLKISELFNLQHLRGKCVIVTANQNTGNNLLCNGYVNVQYLVGANICDGVHAHELTNNRLSQGLKFMHYKINENTNSYLSVWGLKDSTMEYRVRVFDSTKKFEKCFNLEIENQEIIKQLNLVDLGIPKGEGIVQLECDTYNPAATSYIHKKIGEEEFLSVCHMTGG